MKEITATRTAIGASRQFRVLAAILLLLVVSPLAEAGALAEEVVVLATSLLLVAAVYAASDDAGWRRLAAGNAVAWFGLAVAATVTDGVLAAAAADVLLLVFCGITGAATLRHVTRAPVVTFDVLCGALTVYLLIGVAWAVTYDLMLIADPGALAVTASGSHEAWSQALYFSFTTLTTLGYGDVLAVSPVARMWATIESVAGTFYMALLVARLVSLYRP